MDSFMLQCPSINGTGITFQEFTIAIPQVKRVLLKGGIALRKDAVGKSDGATFRIYVDGKKLLDESKKDYEWTTYEFDITSSAGKNVVIRYETDPGSKDDPTADYSVWGDRQLVLEGFKPATAKSPIPLNLSKLEAPMPGTAIPSCGFEHKNSFRMDGDVAIFRYDGRDGMMEYKWNLPKNSADPAFGNVTLLAQMKGDAPVKSSAGRTASFEWAKPATQVDSRWENPSADSVTCVRTFKVGNETAAIRIMGRMIGRSLVFDVSCDKPYISSLKPGSFGPSPIHEKVAVGYYTDSVFNLPSDNLFVNTIIDWRASSCSFLDGTSALYNSLTDGTYNCLKERVIYSASWHLAEVLPNIPNPPSPYRKDLSSRIVLDIWGGAFRDIADSLQGLADYGITNDAVIIHSWQRSGYDNALPAHMPASERLGGDAAMKALIATAKSEGHEIALHQNYIDYYRNYDYFNPNDIALDSQGKQQLAWYNDDTNMQSFGIKPNAMLRLAETQVPLIHEAYQTNAAFLDVHSAVEFGFHTDQRKGEEGAGIAKRRLDLTTKLWQYERDINHGPILGEGGMHWYWSGLLDGVEAQPLGRDTVRSEAVPLSLMVDFDLLKIHPLQFNHGMGYYDRWFSGLRAGRGMPLVVLDQYRMDEVAFGHAGFVGRSTLADIPSTWTEQNLMRPVMERYACARPTEIRYEVDGNWVDGTAAAKAKEWTRVRVRYDSGLVVTANAKDANLQVGDYQLPRFGWLAKGDGVTAYTALRDGVVVDYAETANSVFVNSRNAGMYDFADRQPSNRRAQAGASANRPAEVTPSYTVNLNTEGKVVDFGNIRTNGSVLIERDGDKWTMRALSGKGDLKVELNAQRFPMPTEVATVDGLPVPVKSSGDWWGITLTGAKQYRWQALD